MLPGKHLIGLKDSFDEIVIVDFFPEKLKGFRMFVSRYMADERVQVLIWF
jgi:hypothetical protein